MPARMLPLLAGHARVRKLAEGDRALEEGRRVPSILLLLTGSLSLHCRFEEAAGSFKKYASPSGPSDAKGPVSTVARHRRSSVVAVSDEEAALLALEESERDIGDQVGRVGRGECIGEDAVRAGGGYTLNPIPSTQHPEP